MKLQKIKKKVRDKTSWSVCMSLSLSSSMIVCMSLSLSAPLSLPFFPSCPSYLSLSLALFFSLPFILPLYLSPSPSTVFSPLLSPYQCLPHFLSPVLRLTSLPLYLSLSLCLSPLLSLTTRQTWQINLFLLSVTDLLVD